MSRLVSYILRVGETEDDAAQTRNTNNGILDKSYFYKYPDDYRVPLTEAGYKHAQKVRPIILVSISELLARLNLPDNKVMVVRSPSDRAQGMVNAIFGNAEILSNTPFQPDDDLAAQNYGEYHGISRIDRRNHLLYPESCASFDELGPWMGRPSLGESKHDVFKRNSKVVQKAEDAAIEQGISIVLYIADTGTIFYNLLTCLTNRPPEDALVLREELALDYAALARVMCDTSKPSTLRNFRILWRGEPPQPEHQGPDPDLQDILDAQPSTTRIECNVT
jgi:broad specificity phosphatase PhoE